MHCAGWRSSQRCRFRRRSLIASRRCIAPPSRKIGGPWIVWLKPSQICHRACWRQWRPIGCVDDVRNKSIRCDEQGQSATAVYRETVMAADKATHHLHLSQVPGYLKASLIGLGLIAAGIAAVIFAEDMGRPPHAVAAPTAQRFAFDFTQ